MPESYQLAVLPGVGIGPEVTAAAVIVLKHIADLEGFSVATSEGLIGEPARRIHGNYFPQESQQLCAEADAILFGAVEKGGVQELRQAFDFFANFRPVRAWPGLLDASSLRPEYIEGLDLLIVRELVSGLYFGPSGRDRDEHGEYGFHTMRYADWEIRRIARVALEQARDRRGRLTVAHKQNALPHVNWERLVREEAEDFPHVEVEPMLVDTLAMQLVRQPKHFDVVLAGNLFGDILSDVGAALLGSIGLLGSASLNAQGFGLYEAIHGSAPDIAGRGVANPMGTLASVEAMLRQWRRPDAARRLVEAQQRLLDHGYRTADLARGDQAQVIGTDAFVQLCCDELTALYRQTEDRQTEDRRTEDR